MARDCTNGGENGFGQGRGGYDRGGRSGYDRGEAGSSQNCYKCQEPGHISQLTLCEARVNEEHEKRRLNKLNRLQISQKRSARNRKPNFVQRHL